MSRLMRMAYGHSGTRLKRIPVAASPVAPAADPRWLKFLFIAVWIVVPLLVCRFSLPTRAHLTTVIDTSRLEIQPAPVIPPVPEPRVIPVPPLPKPAPPPPVQTAPKQEEPDPSRHYPPCGGAGRRRSGISTAHCAAAGAALHGTAAFRPDPGPARACYRGTGRTARVHAHTAASGADVPFVGERRASTVRRAGPVEEIAGGAGAVPRPVARRGHTEEYPAEPRAAAVRERKESAGAGEGEAARGVGLARGVSLMNLGICFQPRAEEDAVRGVLGAVGSRRSCRDETGEYQFIGTQRVSSFNLMIRPAKGRRPTNRCEELENAYSCLKAH